MTAFPGPYQRREDGNGRLIVAAHINELQEGLETVPSFVANSVAASVGRGNRTVFLGDSNTAGSSLPAAWVLHEWPYLGCVLSQGRIRFAGNAGIVGNTTAQMLARLQTDVIALAPDKCVIMGGTNDIGASVPLATTITNLTAIIDQLAAAGIEPILCTIPPRNDGFHPEVGALNAGIGEMGGRRGITVLDFHAALTDPANGNFKAGYNVDDVHIAMPGAKAIAVVIRDKLAPLYPEVVPYLAQDIVASGAGNLVTNGIFVGDTDANGVANSWSYLGSGGTQTPSLVAGTGDVFGNWQRFLTTVAGAAWYITQAIVAGYSVGDRLLFDGWLTTILEAGGQNLIIWCYCTGAEQVFSMQTACDITDGIFAMEFNVPTGTTSINPQVIPGAGGTGTVDVAQIALPNLTELGVLT